MEKITVYRTSDGREFGEDEYISALNHKKELRETSPLWAVIEEEFLSEAEAEAVLDFITEHAKEIREALTPVSLKPAKEASPVRVYITIEGGIIQRIMADAPIKVMVADYDTDGVPEEETHLGIRGKRLVQTFWAAGFTSMEGDIVRGVFDRTANREDRQEEEEIGE